MKTFEIDYLSYEGRTATVVVTDLPDDATEVDAQRKAIEDDMSDGDGIHKIIACREV